MASSPQNFSDVLNIVGEKPSADSSQNKTRNYSERLSKELALWIREEIKNLFPSKTVLPPEGKVNTIYGTGHRGKSLDIGMLDDRGYLLLDISIKTFNFKDRRTNNYRKNYTGRFYELLGEELDLRRSYRHAVLVALVFLPEDSHFDSVPSSFALAVKQFSKIARQLNDPLAFGFDFVLVATHSSNGNLFFFDARQKPPKTGYPKEDLRMSLAEALQCFSRKLQENASLVQQDSLPAHDDYDFT
jgi:hypothetical protein